MIAWRVVLQIADGMPATDFAADVTAQTRDEAIRTARSAYTADLAAPFRITEVSCCPVPVEEAL